MWGPLCPCGSGFQRRRVRHPLLQAGLAALGALAQGPQVPGLFGPLVALLRFLSPIMCGMPRPLWGRLCVW